MGLAESGASVNKKRIVGISRRFRNSKGCRLGKFIVVTDDKGIKNILVGGIVMYIIYNIIYYFIGKWQLEKGINID